MATVMDRHNSVSITTSLSPLTVYCAAKLTSSIFPSPLPHRPRGSVPLGDARHNFHDQGRTLRHT